MADFYTFSVSFTAAAFDVRPFWKMAICSLVQYLLPVFLWGEHTFYCFAGIFMVNNY